MVNLVIVSHGAQLGQGVGELARQMLRVIAVSWLSPQALTTQQSYRHRSD